MQQWRFYLGNEVEMGNWTRAGHIVGGVCRCLHKQLVACAWQADLSLSFKSKDLENGAAFLPPYFLARRTCGRIPHVEQDFAVLALCAPIS